RKQHSGFVVRPHRGNDGSIGANGSLQQTKVELAIGIDRQQSDIEAEFLRMREERALNRRIDALSTAAGENDFARLGVEERRHFLARGIERFGELPAKTVNARWVSPGISQKRQHG